LRRSADPSEAEQPVARLDARLDVRGLNCPLPLLRTRKAMERIAIGDRLTVEATDPMSAIDIPLYCREAGHALIASERDGTVLRFVIRREA
jgi:tRNA 2-thiouridine synthesizing protein A